MGDYVWPNSIDEFGIGKMKKGLGFEEFLYNVYLQKGFTVFQTEQMDFGVDLVIYDKNNSTFRIGIQAKNHSDEVGINDILKMLINAKEVYCLNQLIIITTSKLSKEAQIKCELENIIIYERNHVELLINQYKGYKLDPVKSKREQIYKLLYKIMKEEGKTIKSHVFTKRSISEMLIVEPTNMNELISIHGIGIEKSRKYGERIFEIFQK